MQNGLSTVPVQPLPREYPCSSRMLEMYDTPVLPVVHCDFCCDTFVVGMWLPVWVPQARGRVLGIWYPPPNNVGHQVEE